MPGCDVCGTAKCPNMVMPVCLLSTARLRGIRAICFLLQSRTAPAQLNASVGVLWEVPQRFCAANQNLHAQHNTFDRVKQHRNTLSFHSFALYTAGLALAHTDAKQFFARWSRRRLAAPESLGLRTSLQGGRWRARESDPPAAHAALICDVDFGNVLDHPPLRRLAVHEVDELLLHRLHHLRCRLWPLAEHRRAAA